jgi:mono/diheme cytochrome c family protein
MRLADVWIPVCFAFGAGPALAADPQQGRMLYETYCGTCHYERLHERKATNIKTLAGLTAEIAKWSRQVNRSFTPAELDDIAGYLNQSHYKLEK